MAGIEVIELINEPTAAACYYASLPSVEKVTGKVLVFDLGGGTFDVTLCDVNGPKIDVITSRGDKWLGGKDFDNELLNLISDKYKENTKGEIDLKNKKNVYLEIAEQIKRALSVRKSQSEVIDGSKGPVKIEITREEFNIKIQTHLEKLKMLMEEVLTHQTLNLRMYLNFISRRLYTYSNYFRNYKSYYEKTTFKGVNVDEAVAAGAAIYAGIKSKKNLNQAQKKAIADVKLQDVSNFYMGTLVQNEDPVLNRRVTENLIVIERDTPFQQTYCCSCYNS